MTQADDPPRISGKSKTLTKVSSVAVVTVVDVLLKFVVMLVLARLLTPFAFGVASAAMLIVSFAQMFAHAGIASALVQLPEASPGHVRAAMSVSLATGVGLYLLLLASREAGADFLNVDELSAILPLLGVLLPIESLASVSGAMLRRAGRGPLWTTIRASSEAVGAVLVSVPLALLGFSYWALVIGSVASAVANLVLCYTFSRHPLIPSANLALLKSLMKHGLGFFAARLITYFGSSGDNIIVSRALGAEQLGVYARGYRLMEYPALLFRAVSDAVLFPHMASHQHDAARIRGILERGLAMTTILLAPISVFMLLNAEDIVLVLLGNQWAQTVPVFQVLAIFTVFRTGYMIFGAYFRSIGKLAITIQHSTVFAVLVIAMSTYAVSYGPVGVAWGAGAAVAIHFLLLCLRACHHARLPLTSVAATFARGLLYAALFGALVWLGKVAMEPLDPALRLFVLSATVGLFGVVALALAPRWALGDQGVWLRAELTAVIRSRVRRARKRPTGT